MSSDATRLSQKLNIDNTRVGIALGSGSARGWAHIGVLKALAELGIEPYIVAGSSIGALVGAAYVSNKLDDMEKMVKALSWKDLVSYLDMSIIGGGLIHGEKLVHSLRQHIDEQKIESLSRRFGAVATELNSGREVWLQQGDLMDAVRASGALPGLFTPFKKDQHWLIDGGIVDPVPVSLCRAMGAEIVIAVSLNGDIVGKHTRNNNHTENLLRQEPVTNSRNTDLWHRISKQLEKTVFKQKDLILSRLFGESTGAPGLIDVIAGSLNIMQDRITRSRMAGDPPDIILSPKLSQLGLMEFDQGKLAIAEGHACVERNQSTLEHLFSK